MKLLTKEILKKLPSLCATENLSPEKTKVVVKFFHPFTTACWYVTEFDPKQKIFFGFVNLGDDQMAELGYFGLNELEAIKIGGLKLERDIYWDQETTLDKVISFQKR